MVNPNPLALQRFLHRTYSLNPPGPAHTSAKYNNELESSKDFPYLSPIKEKDILKVNSV